VRHNIDPGSGRTCHDRPEVGARGPRASRPRALEAREKDGGGCVADALALSTVVVAASDHVSTPMNQETVLLNLKTGKYYSLNRVGTFIWEQLKEPASLAQVVDATLAKFDVDRARCEADVRRIIQGLVDAGFAQTRA
jgi:hypothetical protein